MKYKGVYMNNENLKPATTETAKRGGTANGIKRHKDKEAKRELVEMGLDTDIRNYIFLKVYKQATTENNSKALLKLFDTFITADYNPWEDGF